MLLHGFDLPGEAALSALSDIKTSSCLTLWPLIEGRHAEAETDLLAFVAAWPGHTAADNAWERFHEHPAWPWHGTESADLVFVRQPATHAKAPGYHDQLFRPGYDSDLE